MAGWESMPMEAKRTELNEEYPDGQFAGIPLCSHTDIDGRVWKFRDGEWMVADAAVLRVHKNAPDAELSESFRRVADASQRLAEGFQQVADAAMKAAMKDRQ